MGKEVENTSIDVMKFILAFLVVAIHTDPLQIVQGSFLYRVWGSITSLAVPLFFIATGYLIETKTSLFSIDEELKYYHKKIYDIAKLYIVWSIFYLPLAVWKYLSEKMPIQHAVLDYARGFFLYGEHYNSYILWYLLSSLYTFIFIRILRKYALEKEIILLIGVIIMMVGIVITSYTLGKLSLQQGILLLVIDSFSKLFISGRIFTGFIYIPLGQCMAKRKIDLINWLSQNAMKRLALFCFFVILIILRATLDNEFIKELIRFFLVSIVFLLTICKDTMLTKETSLKFREYSSIIYFIHLYVWTFLYMIFYGAKIYGFKMWLLTSTVSLLFSILFQIIKKRIQHSNISNLIK